MGKFDVRGGKILIIGDLHLSDYFKGRHKNYLQNCYDVMEKLDKIVADSKPSAIVLLGDLVGWTKPNIISREVLSNFCKYFIKWNTYGTIFSVRGNHDTQGYPDFRLFSDLNLIVTSEKCDGHFDFYGNESDTEPSVRFHIVDYKEEHSPLAIAGGDISNVVLGHNNYTIAGQTTWYSGGEGVELGHLENFADIDMVISGHIHNPSPDFCETTMLNGKNCTLYYPGCPTRPVYEKNNMYDSVKVVEVVYNPSISMTDFNTIDVVLKPAEEVFETGGIDDAEKTQLEIDEEMRKASLSDILSDLVKYRMNQTDPISQIANIPNASGDAKRIATDYLQMAMNG